MSSNKRIVADLLFGVQIVDELFFCGAYFIRSLHEVSWIIASFVRLPACAEASAGRRRLSVIRRLLLSLCMLEGCWIFAGFRLAEVALASA